MAGASPSRVSSRLSSLISLPHSTAHRQHNKDHSMTQLTACMTQLTDRTPQIASSTQQLTGNTRQYTPQLTDRPPHNISFGVDTCGPDPCRGCAYSPEQPGTPSAV